MAKLRSISTDIWTDTWFESLSSNEKVLFIYLLTNDKTNMLGVYEISIRKISFDTGLNNETILKALKGFETLNKVYYKYNYIIMVNFLKNQNFNGNMKKSAIDVYNNLPNQLKNSNINFIINKNEEGFETLSNPFEWLCNGSEIELNRIEEEKNIKEGVLKVDNFSFSEFWDLYNKKIDNKKCIEKYKNINQLDRQKIKDTLPYYLSTIKDKQFLKNPLTYLNGQCWNDEIKGSVKMIKTDELNTDLYLIPTNDRFGLSQLELIELCKQGKYKLL